MNEEIMRDAIANPQNMGEMADADAVGTMGSADCGDMVRMWLKFSEKDGQKVIDRASFQSFGCQTAIAVASVATELLKGKSLAEARQLSAEDLSGPMGALPPMKIHCGQMVEGALRAALEADSGTPTNPQSTAPIPMTTLSDSLPGAGMKAGKIKVVLQS
jgi:nitrogen fixation protein NifU and related proteins